MADKPKRIRGGYDPALFQGPVYHAWTNMKTRCRNAKLADFHRYGGRGITVAPEWELFASFYRDMGPSWRLGLTLDRVDNDKGYSKENCRWVDRTAQANNRRTNHVIEFGGESKTLAEWARHVGMKQTTLKRRVNDYGWSIERALSESVRRRGEVRVG